MNINEHLKRQEEEKRERNWDPAERWRVLQELMAWGAALPNVRRNTRERCLELQQEKLAWLDAAEAEDR